MTPAQIQHQIGALEFAQTELILFLDVHPNDDLARRQWQRNKTELERLDRQYTQMTGKAWPLYQNKDGGTLAWINEPWPWEN